MKWIFPLTIALLALPGCLANEADTASSGRFAIDVDLPAEMIYDFALVMDLPVGVHYRPESLLVNGESRTVAESARGANDGTDQTAISWAIDRIDNIQDQDLRLEFDLLAADISQNRAGTIIAPCRTALRWRDEEGVIHAVSGKSDEIMIVEPDLVLERQVNSAGSCGTVSLSIYHSEDSTSSAYEAELVESPGPGLAYVPGSMKVLSGPGAEMSASGSGILKWAFAEVNPSWTKWQKIEVQYLFQPSAAGNAVDSTTEPDHSCAALTFSSTPETSPGRIYSRSACSAEPALLREANLSISLEAERDCVPPGELVNYTVRYECAAANASDIVVEEHCDPLLSFVSASPEPDSGSQDRWTLGSLFPGEAGLIKITAKVNQSSLIGQELENRVEIASAGIVEAQASCTVSVCSPVSLLLVQEASSDLLGPGGSFNYTLTISNRGTEVAGNVSIEDLLDDRLIFDPQSGPSPEPSAIWQDAGGFHLCWDAESLDAEELKPGESRQVSLEVSLPSSEASEELITNLCSFSSDQASGEAEPLETFVVRSIFVRKKADRVSSSRGGLINYTIFYGNEGLLPVTGAVLIDVLPEDAEYLGADPSPSLVQGRLLVWDLGTLGPGAQGSIDLRARIKEQPEMVYREEKRISGLGIVSSSQKLSTSRDPPVVVNYANITALCNESEVKDSSTAEVILEDAAGTELQAAEHGSGRIKREQTLDFHSGLGLIAVEDRLSASYSPADEAVASLGQPWGWRLSAENRFRDEGLHESGQYLRQMEVERSLLMDRNQTTYFCQDRISGGKMEWEFSSARGGATRIYQSYAGDVSGNRFLDSYGRGMKYGRESSGQGFSSWEEEISGSADGRISSLGHGSGSFSFYEAGSNEPSLFENMTLDHSAFNQSLGSLAASYSSKWSHALAVQDAARSREMGVDVRYADFLRHESMADSSTLSWSGSFAGQGSIESSVSDSSLPQHVELDQSFRGQYRMDLAMSLHDIPRFLGPHLNVSKRGCWVDGRTIRFRINVTNNGNRTLAPVEVVDLMPEGLTLLNSTLRPKVEGHNLSWSWLSLPIGRTYTIDLYARWDGLYELSANQVVARGQHEGRWIEARASCPTGIFRLPLNDDPSGQKEAAGYVGGGWSPPACLQAGSNLSPCLEMYYQDDHLNTETGWPLCSCTSASDVPL
ncbi:MAG: DUF11 domain-containing protein [Methanotrichaceae archaeon]|nr:DUF11 domain-containing protein [Methanotrichaceae archaeon]